MANKPTGYPEKWMDVDGNVKCLARNCNFVWQTQAAMHHRTAHLTATHPLGLGPDHTILLVMTKQKRCPHCMETIINGQNGRRSYKVLHQHEWNEHDKKEDTATIEGFVVLARRGLLEPDVVRLAEKSIHQRLLHMIKACDIYDGPSGLAAFWGIEDADHKTSMEIIEQKITTTNKNLGRPLWHPMTPEEFLSEESLSVLDLSTDDYIRQMDFNWTRKRASLKEWYAVGKI